MGDWPLLDGQRHGTHGQSGSSSFFKSITAGAIHTKGNYVELVASNEFSTSGLIIMPGYVAPSSEFLFDIAVGGEGSEQDIISNLCAGCPGLAGSKRNLWQYFFPIFIPAGSRISARCQSDNASQLIRLGIMSIGGGFSHPTAFNEIITYGANTGTTRGVTVDPGATVDTKGDWVQITASTTRAAKGLVVGAGSRGNANMAWAAWLLDIGIGTEGSEQILIPNLHFASSDNVDKISPNNTVFIPVSIPAGTRIAARSQCSINDATDRLFDVFLYCAS